MTSKFDRSTGTVKFFNESKKFGFITPDSGGRDIFFHVSGISGPNKMPREKQRCSFEVEDGPKGEKAVDLELH